MISRPAEIRLDDCVYGCYASRMYRKNSEFFCYFFSAIAIIFSFLPLRAAVNFSRSSSTGQKVAQQLIVRLSQEANPLSVRDALQANRIAPLFPNLRSSTSTESVNLSRIYLLHFPLRIDLEIKRQQCLSDLEIEAVTYNYIRPTQSVVPNDPKYIEQWNLEKIGMPEAWEIERGSSQVVIALVDTGVDYTHADFQGQMWQNQGEIPDNRIDDDGNGYVDDLVGWDFTDDDHKPIDQTGHGTHVAGIVGAKVDNQTGIAGVAWNCKIMAIRVGASQRYGGAGMRDSNSAAGIIYAVDNGAKVINMSWGSDRLSFVIRDVLTYADVQGVLLVAAAGNDMKGSVIYPAGYRQVMAVASGNQDDERFYQSNFGAGVDIVAPGNEILSTQIQNTYRLLSGTSMAGPHVVGVAALMMSKRPNLTAEEIRQILVSTAKPMPKSPEFMGAGYLDAATAIQRSISLQAHITAPETGIGSHRQIEVWGSANGLGFQSWQLQYGLSTTPTNWISIEPLSFTLKNNQLLSVWNTEALSEGIYTVRLLVKGSDQQQINDEVVVYVDHSPPVLQHRTFQNWLAGNRYLPVVLWATDDPTTDTLRWKQVGTTNWKNQETETSVGREHIFSFLDLPTGDYEFSIISTNAAGLTTTDHFTVRSQDDRIPSSGFRRQTLGVPPVHLADFESPIDFDQDGKIELVGLPLSGSFTTGVRIYERNQRGLFPLRHAIVDKFIPIFVGDLDRDGQLEIAGYDDDQVFILESRGKYPERKSWSSEIIEIAQVADLDQDGRMEIIGLNNYTGQIIIFENRGNDTFDQVLEVNNSSAGTNVVKRLGIGDLDGDKKMEVVFGDSEGDLFVYTSSGDDRLTRTWQGKLPLQDIRLVTVGDLTGDGIPDFVIGGKADQPSLPSIATQWGIYAFSYQRSAGDYQQIWSQSFLPYTPEGSDLAIADLDNDRQNDLVIAITPNLYLFDHNLKPVWHQPIGETPKVTVADFNADGQAELYVNQGRQMVAWTRTNADSQKQPPWELAAKVADPTGQRRPTEVTLNWQSEAGQFNIYRAIGKEGAWQKIGASQTLTFLDRDLRPDTVYRYAVSASDEAETTKSNEVKVTVKALPELKEVKPLNRRQVGLTFDGRLDLNLWEDLTDYDIFNKQNFTLFQINQPSNTVTQQPTSVILDRMDQRLVLTFDNLQADQVYRLTISIGDEAVFATPKSESLPANLDYLQVYPNPVHPNEFHKGAVIFDQLPIEAEIEIYNPVGQRLETLRLQVEDRGQKLWYLQNQEGVGVASGIYIYVVQHDNQRRTGKIAVIK